MEILNKYTELAQRATEMTAAWLVIKMLFGALNCFLGYKLLKVWVAVTGFFLGAGIGFGVVRYFTDKTWIVWCTVLAAGFILGLLAYEIYLVGAFLLGWVMTASAAFTLGRVLGFGDKMEVAMLIAGAVLGILVGALIVRFARPSIILLTGISGGISVGSGVIGLMKADNVWLMLGIGAVFAVIGIFVQLKTTPGHKKTDR